MLAVSVSSLTALLLGVKVVEQSRLSRQYLKRQREWIKTEHAAWTSVARALLNLDETISKN